MKIFSSFLLLIFFTSRSFALDVTVPRLTSVNLAKKDFIRQVSSISQKLFPTYRSAIAPFGGVKITPFAELDLQELIIVTNSFPGTPSEIRRQFKQGSEELARVLRQNLNSGAMSTTEVLSVTNGAQILARLKLELGVTEVEMSYWTSEGSVEDFSDRSMKPEDTAVATVFEFTYHKKKSRLVFISSYIHSDSAFPQRPGYPVLLSSFLPENGVQWIYLSADGLGHFSGKRDNGFHTANQELLSYLHSDGTVLLDYPTDSNFHLAQVYGGIYFMQGRLPLEEMGLSLLQTIPIDTSGIFGYCLRPGDEVRIYQNHGTVPGKLSPIKVRQAGPKLKWVLL